MSYTELKQELEKVLNEDLSNRQSLQEMRRDVFLRAESSQKTQSLMAEKESEISNLRSTISERENDLLSHQQDVEKMQRALDEQRMAFESEREHYLAEIESLKNTIAGLQPSQAELIALKEESGKLSIENTHFAAKIRELIFHIDEMNEQQEARRHSMEKELHDLRSELKNNQAEKNQLSIDLTESGAKEEEINALNEELESTKTRIILLESQRQTAVELIQVLNTHTTQLENQVKAVRDEFSYVVDRFVEEKDLLVQDNAELIAEMSLLKLENEDLYEEQKNHEARTQELQAQIDEFSDSLSELRSKEQIIHSLTEEKEKLNAMLSEFNSRPYVDEESYTAQIEVLHSEIHSLTKSLDELNSASRLKSEALEFEKANLLLKLEELESQLSSLKESKTEEPATDNEEFIDKLFQQINLLNEEKSLLQTENEEAHTELKTLQASCSELSQIIENQKNTIESLEETNKQATLAEAFLGTAGDKTSLKLRINELVREIDRCIALLSV
jgi:chromosome segregation ATPase